LSLVRGRDAEAVLRAGVEAARCKSLGAALIEIFGAPRALDLTATLRLARAAEASGVTVFLLRIRAGQEAAQETGTLIGPLAGTHAKTGPPPSAAASRWRARAQNSRALAANAPGAPCFSVTLLRHRGGLADRSWRLEWLRDRGLFHEAADSLSATLSGPVAAVPADRQVASGLERERRATG
jgi:protein ImuA